MFQRKSLALVILIAAVAAGLSVASFQYYNFTEDQIIETARRDIRNNAQIEANAISHSLSDRITAVLGNLKLVASAPAVQRGDPDAQQLFDASQEITARLTDGYYWLDRDGRIITYSEVNAGKYPDFRGDDLSFRDYSKVPRDMRETFLGTIIDSRDGVPRMYLSEPVLDRQTGQFEGVIVAAISSSNAGQFVQSQLLPQYRSTTGLVDRGGLIVYSNNQTLIGTHYQDEKFQVLVPPAIKGQFNALLDRSLTGVSGMEDITYAGNTATIAYEPVMVGGDHLWTVYVVYPHVLASETLSLLDQQRTFNILVIVAITAAAALIAALILTSNRRLQQLVKQRTSELQSAVDSLARANEQLKEHDRLQREFINIAAHELRTPIQPVVALAGMILSEYDGGREKVEVPKEQMEIIDRNAKRLQKLSSDILDVTRIEGGRLVLDKVVVDMNDKVRNVIADAPGRMPGGSRLKISFNPAKDDSQKGAAAAVVVPLPVEADKTRIYEVLANLVRNAIRFSEPGGTIEISTERQGDEVVVKVQDRGPGIPDEMAGRLFTKFSTGSEKSGTGLGLYISKSIVEAHGGRIWAENNADGKGGATFAFALPLAKRQQQ